MSQSHQLAAIMFADIVGYTTLKQEDEQLAMQPRDKMKQKPDAEIRLRKDHKIQRGWSTLCTLRSLHEKSN